MRAKQLHKDTIGTRCYHLTVIMNECRFHRFSDISRTKVERLLLDKVHDGMSARTHNAHVAACLAFGNWAIKQGRILVNPFAGLVKQNERADRRRIRRALTEEEATKLITAARERPLHDFLHKPRRDNKDDIKTAKKVKSETIDYLRWLGKMRATAYKTMLQTGLRFGECRSIRIGDTHLDADIPFLELQAADEKARRGAQIALHRDLAEELKHYLAERILRLTGHSNVISIAGVAHESLFDLPEQITRVFDRDLVYAGLATVDEDNNLVKKDAHDRTLDVHCLRHTFITMLAKSGVPLQVAQKAARHSDPSLTSNIYTHIQLGDIADAVNTLPRLSGQVGEITAVSGGSKVSPKVSPPDRNSVQKCARICNSAMQKGERKKTVKTRENPINTGEKDGAGHGVRTRDIQLGKLALYQLS